MRIFVTDSVVAKWPSSQRGPGASKRRSQDGSQ